jgi:putative NADH-flavin reductase
MPTIALLGSTGQIGRSILLALLTTTVHQVVQLVRPASESKAESINITLVQKKRLWTVPVDLLASSTDELASILSGVGVVASALNGKGMAAEGKIQDAAERAGVKMFYPGEFGMHHVYSGEDGYGHLHPVGLLSLLFPLLGW